MEWIVKQSTLPDSLDMEWDKLAHCYYLKREFLWHLQTHNFCNQVYYELFQNNRLVAGTIVYTAKTNLLTFINVPTPLKFRVVGLPVSIASVPYVGDCKCFNRLLGEILKREKGLILGLNFLQPHLDELVVTMRTLPTMMLRLETASMADYVNSLRHPYRRRFKRIIEKFKDVTSVTTACSVFSETHYRLYLDVMKTTTTKLETLSVDAFRYLPPAFRLTTFYSGEEMLMWYILLPDQRKLFYYMCGINYKRRDDFEAYNNSLFDIVCSSMHMGCTLIDLGQTAEIAKSRVGAKPEERLMFMYHSNPLVLGIIRYFRNFITYSKKPPEAIVFKSDKLAHHEDTVRPSGAIT